MINFKPDEKIAKAFEVKQSLHGRGIFYITNFGVYLETQRNGPVLDLSFEILKAYKNTGRDSFRIEWVQDDHRRYYEFRVEGSAKQVFDTYTITNKEFAKSVSEFDALKQMFACQNVRVNHEKYT
jgi:hypothetical protein